MIKPGTLFIVATPIGNLLDISYRAIKVLGSVQLIAAEDTRYSRKLLQYFSISSPMMVSLHKYNESYVSKYLINRLQEGTSIALISNSGTPLISDPGFIFVCGCKEKGLPIISIPGPSALIAALSVSGLQTNHFYFEGFLPRNHSKRLKRLQTLKKESVTLIFYESPHRILKTLEDMENIFGKERQAVIARELTKKYETIINASISRLKSIIASNPNQQCGEFVLAVSGQDRKKSEQTMSPIEIEINHLLKVLLSDLSLKHTVKLATRITGQRKNILYNLSLCINNSHKKVAPKN